MTLSYEKAKELKDAGFPQMGLIKNLDMIPPTEEGEGKGSWLFSGQEAAYAPTLSELIKACGDGLQSITQAHNNGEAYWWASASGDRIREFSADTPEEAVANLWLALNKNANS